MRADEALPAYRRLLRCYALWLEQGICLLRRRPAAVHEGGQRHACIHHILRCGSADHDKSPRGADHLGHHQRFHLRLRRPQVLDHRHCHPSSFADLRVHADGARRAHPEGPQVGPPHLHLLRFAALLRGAAGGEPLQLGPSDRARLPQVLAPPAAQRVCGVPPERPRGDINQGDLRSGLRPHGNNQGYLPCGPFRGHFQRADHHDAVVHLRHDAWWSRYLVASEDLPRRIDHSAS
mmetsp:Transcript_47128/g.136193  ORF Transcript_47128/g.136193 Transcript_47128/m.136193 type:complete len:235 (+) Transcript_47128:353-1057(+)